MRTLGNWAKYLEEQEERLQKALGERAASDEQDRPAKEQDGRESGRPAAPESASAREPATGGPVAPGSVDAAAVPGLPRTTEAPPAVGRQADADAAKAAARLRRRPPEQSLAPDGGPQEVAQNSYGQFKETREELLQRLLDPQLTLEETARVLDVCPATVRRYTNRGLLRHFRTPGNQRRFRLSDVLAFLESQTAGDGGKD